ncbi:MAG: glycosyltransferase [Desulfovibrionaceae bacterium]
MTQDAILAKVQEIHRLFGYVEPAQAALSAQHLLDGLTQPLTPVMRRRVALAASLLRQSLAINPFDPMTASLVAQLQGLAPASPLCARWTADVERLMAGQERLPLTQAFAALDALGAAPEALEACAASDAPLAVRHLAASHLWQTGERDAFLRAAAALCAHAAGRAAAPFYAWGAWGAGEAALARQWLGLGPRNFLTYNLLAAMALATGDTDGARGLWAESLAFEPGQAPLIHRLRELVLPAAPPALADVLAGDRVHVGFYTFNKFETTLGTLQSLLASDIGDAAVTLLNNGSTAFTADDFSAAVARVAAGRPVQVINLPVNVGAPVARNWLYSLDASRTAAFVAFLDDDVVLPPDWLRCYVQDMRADAGLAVAGPKGMNPSPLPTIQYVYRFFQEVGEQHIRFTNNAPLMMDLGQFDYRRPCLSVMGCCHLFNRPLLERLGVPDFDVRFNPSQVDDLEHDIQVCKAGGRVLYDGRVRVVHLQDAGRAAPLTRAGWGHVWGNHMKMEAKFTGDELRGVDEVVRAQDEAHWQDALRGVWDVLPPACQVFFGPDIEAAGASGAGA